MSEMPVDVNERGVDNDDAEGEGGGEGECACTTLDEALKIARKSVRHGVIKSASRNEGNEANNAEKRCGGLEDSRHHLSVERNGNRNDEITNDLTFKEEPEKE